MGGLFLCIIYICKQQTFYRMPNKNKYLFVLSHSNIVNHIHPVVQQRFYMLIGCRYIFLVYIVQIHNVHPSISLSLYTTQYTCILQPLYRLCFCFVYIVYKYLGIHSYLVKMPERTKKTSIFAQQCTPSALSKHKKTLLVILIQLFCFLLYECNTAIGYYVIWHQSSKRYGVQRGKYT